MNAAILSTTDILTHAAQLSDAELLARVKALAQREREATAALIAHLAVLDERKLYRDEGYSSLFSYCTQALHLSENAAYWRIEAGRAARKFPIILDLLADGSVHLTAVVLLAPHLTAENHRGLLSAATHKSKRDVEELIVALRPHPPMPSAIRKLPTASNSTIPLTQPHAAGIGVGLEDGLELSKPSFGGDLVSLTPEASVAPQASTFSMAPAGPALKSPSRRGSVEPLAPQRYRVQFEASTELYAKLRQAQDLLRYQIPGGDLEQVIDRALTVLLEKLTRQKYAATNRPRDKADRGNGSQGEDGPGKGSPGKGSRHIPAEVRRAVSNRDKGQCAFVSETGRRCTERGFLEFHHVVPYSLGGQATVGNIQLRCRAHNGYEAERYFGRRPP